MAAARQTPYVSVNLTVPARDALQSAALQQSARVNQRLSMSAILLAALTVAVNHPDELTAAITTKSRKGD